MTVVTNPIRDGVDTEKMFTTLDLVKERPELARFQFRVRNCWIGGPHTARLSTTWSPTACPVAVEVRTTQGSQQSMTATRLTRSRQSTRSSTPPSSRQPMHHHNTQPLRRTS
jgi:hypothetical protein